MDKLAYLSRVPEGQTAATYDGSGDWVKLYAASTLANSSWAEPEGLVWAIRRKHSFLFTLPAETPPGEYLLRAEGIALHAAHKLNRSLLFFLFILFPIASSFLEIVLMVVSLISITSISIHSPPFLSPFTLLTTFEIM